ncbi:MAG: RDD family protein [Salibacteraceae bacterium]
MVKPSERLKEELIDIGFDAPKKYTPASRMVRLRASAIDHAILILVLTLLIKLKITYLRYSVVPTFLEQSLDNLILALVSYFSFFFFLELIWNRTPGNWALGTKVCNQVLAPPSVGQLLFRNLFRFLPFGYFTMFFDDQNRTSYDGLSNTLVVSTR